MISFSVYVIYLLFQIFERSRMENGPTAKRKKFFTKNEILQKLKENDDNVRKVAEEISEELCPFDVSDEEAMMMEDRVERLQETTKKLSNKIYRLKRTLATVQSFDEC